jgi:hypothetical protein
MADWPHEIGRALHLLAVAGEEAVDAGRRALSKHLGTNVPAHIAAYAGYSDEFGTHLSGRILSRKPGGGPLDDDSVWINLANTWRRWESDEV